MMGHARSLSMHRPRQHRPARTTPACTTGKQSFVCPFGVVRVACAQDGSLALSHSGSINGADGSHHTSSVHGLQSSHPLKAYSPLQSFDQNASGSDCVGTCQPSSSGIVHATKHKQSVNAHRIRASFVAQKLPLREPCDNGLISAFCKDKTTVNVLVHSPLQEACRRAPRSPGLASHVGGPLVRASTRARRQA